MGNLERIPLSIPHWRELNLSRFLKKPFTIFNTLKVQNLIESLAI